MKKTLLGLLVAGSFIFVGNSAEAKTYEGKISIDGSSTVYPISEAVAEAARADKEFRKLRVGVSLSGTGGGMKKFCQGEIEITGASRPIKPSEAELCKKNSVSFIELPVAFDGIAVVVNKENACAKTMTVAQLKKIWEPAAQGKITNWKQINPACGDMPLTLYGPGHDSGTFDYFTEAVVGKSKSSRSDFTASEDDNVLAVGVAGDKGALGYFGFAYYLGNKDKIHAVKIIDDNAGVMPSIETIADGTYTPLARPIMIYVSEAAAKREEVAKFVEFYIKNAAELSAEVGYAPLGSDSTYSLVESVFKDRSTGTFFGKAKGASIEKVLKRQL